ncbi:MAG: hypothetical protein KAR42_01135 [candidate division Zixibacteria bacterium]|nr:hypothetical protein [candidate division Zixibacteria bacterium]
MSTRVLVLNCFVKGWNILKNLSDNGFDVCGADYRAGAPGLFSNCIKDKSYNLIYPNPKTDEDAFVKSVVDFIQEKNIDIVLPVNAAEMMALAKKKDIIEKHALFPFENYHKLLLFHDKKYFFELLGGNIDVAYLPRCWSIGDTTEPVQEVVAKAGLTGVSYSAMENYKTADHFINDHSGIVFPLIVKTRRSTSSVGVYRVHSVDELKTACAKLENEDIIVQENIVGRGTGISSIHWDKPNLLQHFGHKRVREFPISGGASTSREPWDIDNLRLTDQLSKLLQTLNWHGVVMFEFKEMVQQGKLPDYKFLEANPRFWGSVPLAMANGVHFPTLLCQAALNRDIPKTINSKNVRARILFSDTLSMVLNVFKGRNVGYNFRDYFNFRRLFLDDIDFSDFPATRKIIVQMLREFYSRIIKRK